MPYFQQINYSDPDVVKSYVTNGEASTALAQGSAVCWDYTTAADGATVIIPTTAMLQLPAGVTSTTSIAAGAKGLIVTHGHTTALVDGTTDVTVGDPLIISDTSVNLTKASLITGAIGVARMSFVAGATYTTNSASLKKVFVGL